MEKKKMSLPKQIVLALILGIAVGLIFYFIGKPEFTTNYLKPFGTIFVNLLKFIVVPVVLLSMIDGIISMGDMKKVGSVGWKTVAYFLVTTAIACVIGLLFANIFNNAGLFPTLALEEGAVWDKATSANFMDTLVAIFPSNMWKSFTEANMLQVIVIALMFEGEACQGSCLYALCGHRARDGVHHCPQPHRRVHDDGMGRRHAGPRDPDVSWYRAWLRVPRLHRPCSSLLLFLCQGLCGHQPHHLLQEGFPRDDFRIYLHLLRRYDPPEQGVRR